MRWDSLGIEYSTKPLDRIAYSFDASLITNIPEAVFWPKSTDEVVKLVEFCYENEIAITPRGAGTALTGAAVPRKIVVDLSRMNKILSKSKVQPGVTLYELNTYLSKKGLFFPVIPSSYRVCTIGGMISTNASGLRALKFGSTKEWIKSVKIVDGTGKLRKMDSRICGTEGTLGIIVEAEIKTTEYETEKTMDVLTFPSLSELIDAVEDLKKRDIYILEYLDKTCSELSGFGKNYTLIAGYADDSGSVKNTEDVLRRREGVYPILASRGYYTIEDPKVDELLPLLTWFEQKEIPCFGHIGVGILHPCFSNNNRTLINEMYQLVKELNGEISGEHGYGLKKPFPVTDEWKKLKRKYDPKNIMNPLIPKPKETIPDKCVGCGLCRTCPIFSATLKETYSPRTKWIVDKKSDVFYYCTLCGLCETMCPVGIKTRERVRKMREIMVRAGFETEKNKEVIEHIKKTGYPISVESKEWHCC